MLYVCLLASLLLGAVSADFPKVTCNGIQPMQNVNADSLTGNWVAVESVAFKDGQPFNPVNVTDDKRTHTCIYSRDDGVTDSGVKAKLFVHVPGKDDPIVDSTTLTYVNGERGRLSMHSDIQDRDNWEFIVLDAVAEKYLVYMLCQPPNEAQERLPERVNLMSRHADHADHAVLTTEEITEVRKTIAEKVGIKGRGIVPVKYCHSCWAGYPKN